MNGCSYRKRSRRGDCDDDAGADRGGLLHHLDRDPAGEDDGAGAAGHALRGQRAGELVQRIVASDILAQDHVMVAGPEKAGGMGGTRCVIEDLRCAELLDRGADLIRRKADLPLNDAIHPVGFGQTLDTAQPAAGRANEPSAPILQQASGPRPQPGSHLDAAGSGDDRQVVDLAGVVDDAFGQAEAEREVGEI